MYIYIYIIFVPFCAERDKIQRQFKLFRDTKANELQTLLKEKRVLETRLTKYVNLHGTESDSNPSGQELYGEGGEILGHLNDMGNIAGTLDAESTADVSNHFAFKGVEHSHFGSDSQEPYTNIKKGLLILLHIKWIITTDASCLDLQVELYQIIVLLFI